MSLITRGEHNTNKERLIDVWEAWTSWFPSFLALQWWTRFFLSVLSQTFILLQVITQNLWPHPNSQTFCNYRFARRKWCSPSKSSYLLWRKKSNSEITLIRLENCRQMNTLKLFTMDLSILACFHFVATCLKNHILPKCLWVALNWLPTCVLASHCSVPV